MLEKVHEKNCAVWRLSEAIDDVAQKRSGNPGEGMRMGGGSRSSRGTRGRSWRDFS